MLNISLILHIKSGFALKCGLVKTIPSYPGSCSHWISEHVRHKFNQHALFGELLYIYFKRDTNLEWSLKYLCMQGVRIANELHCGNYRRQYFGGFVTILFLISPPWRKCNAVSLKDPFNCLVTLCGGHKPKVGNHWVRRAFNTQEIKHYEILLFFFMLLFLLILHEGKKYKEVSFSYY